MTTKDTFYTIAMLAVCISACAPDASQDTVVSLDICFPVEQPDAGELATCSATWRPGTKLAIAPPADFPCDSELAQAKAAWSAHGIEFIDVADADDIIEITGPTHDPASPRGRTSTTVDHSTGYLVEAGFLIRECDALAIAHEIGHSLGLCHATRAGALMSPSAEGWDLRDAEVDAIRERAERPAVAGVCE